ncbi:MAG: hypothetical protein HZB16_09880 [Armatimonadetes bacterium]|nr:hypothetical protein [Armatimonadota bacterium]
MVAVLVYLLVSFLSWWFVFAVLGLLAFTFAWHGTAALCRHFRKPCGRRRVVFGPSVP